MSISGERQVWIKSVLIGVSSAVVVIAVLMCLMCVIFLSAASLPYEYLEYLMLAVDMIGVLVGAYIAARISGQNGLIIGLLTSGIILVALMIAGFASGFDSLSMITLLRAVVILGAGAFGGIRGVNRKEKIRIK